jgi:Zn-finger nucleic acid-binding protein
MTVEALNCPNCGAGVSSDSTQCEFCRTRLKTMACPSCFGLMFLGSQYCGHCGAKAVVPNTHNGAAGECPRCRQPLDNIMISTTSLRECQRCGGMWSDIETFESVCSDREKQSAVLGFASRRELAAAPPAKISYVPCPDCKQLMNRSNFARASGVIIDVCKKHGVWFDAEELPRIIEFIQKGGMELARQRERNEIEQERDRLRDERHRFGAVTANDPDKGDSSYGFAGSGVKSFLKALFE